jgi:osmotically-inducible protein OsmY
MTCGCVPDGGGLRPRNRLSTAGSTMSFPGFAATKERSMKSDTQLRSEVQAELDWEPAIDAKHVGVIAHDGIVTLTGRLDSYAQKAAIEDVVWRVAGVRAIALELDVALAPDHARNDSDIAQAVENALQWHVSVPDRSIRLKVEKGWVTLMGEVDWDFQRQSAADAVRCLSGVRGLSNQVTLKPRATPADIGERVAAALKRHAQREAGNIWASVSGSTVTLHGHVDASADRAEAQAAAWSAPGVARVVNEIRIQ